MTDATLIVFCLVTRVSSRLLPEHGLLPLRLRLVCGEWEGQSWELSLRLDLPSTSLRRLIPSRHTETFLEFSGHFSRLGRPAASTRVGKMSTNSTRDSENRDWVVVMSYMRVAGWMTWSITPGRCSIMGAL